MEGERPEGRWRGGEAEGGEGGGGGIIAACCPALSRSQSLATLPSLASLHDVFMLCSSNSLKPGLRNSVIW